MPIAGQLLRSLGKTGLRRLGFGPIEEEILTEPEYTTIGEQPAELPLSAELEEPMTFEELQLELEETPEGLMVTPEFATAHGLEMPQDQQWFIKEAPQNEYGYEIVQQLPTPGLKELLETGTIGPVVYRPEQLPAQEIPEGWTMEVTPAPEGLGLFAGQYPATTTEYVSPERIRFSEQGYMTTPEGQTFSPTEVEYIFKYNEFIDQLDQVLGEKRYGETIEQDPLVGYLEEGNIPEFISQLITIKKDDRVAVDELLNYAITELGWQEFGIEPEYIAKFWEYERDNELTGPKAAQYIYDKQAGFWGRLKDDVLAGVGTVFGIVEAPWQRVVLTAKVGIDFASGRNPEETREVWNRLQESPAMAYHDMEEIWKETVGATKGFEKVALNISRYLNPAYLVPVGGTLGVGSKFVAHVPIIGRSAELAAAGTQAIEKGIAYPIAKPAEMTFKQLEKVGSTLSEKNIQRLVKNSHFESELPPFDEMINASLADNWVKSTLINISKAPVVGPAAKKVIESGLGWKTLVTREGAAIEDIIGRGAVGYKGMLHRGVNAGRLKGMELRDLISDPVKYFGFREGYSESFANRLLPEFKGEANAGTLEHIFAHPEQYSWEAKAKGRAYVAKLRELQDWVFNHLEAEGVAPEDLIDDWIHRVVQTTSRGTRRGGRAIGSKPSYEKHRQFKTMAEGIEWFQSHPELGASYSSNPEQIIDLYVQEAFKKIADQRFVNYVAEGMEVAGKEMGEKPTERLLKRFPDLFEQIETPEGRVLATRAALRQTELQDAKNFIDHLNTAIRGELPTEQTLRAIERRFPDLGRRFRGIVKEEDTLVRDYLTGTGKRIPSMSKMRGQFETMTPEERLTYRLKAQELGEDKGAQRIIKVLDDVDDRLGRAEADTAPKEMFDYPQEIVPEGKAKVEPITPEGADAIKPKIEGVKGMEEEAAAKVTYDLPKPKTKTARKKELQDLKKEVQEIAGARRVPAAEARAEKAFRMEQVRQPGLEEGYIMQPFAGGKIYDTEFVDAFNKFFGWDKGIGALRVTSDVAGILRITKAALDASAMAIQGLPSWGMAHSYLLTNPVMGTKLMGAWYKAFFESARAFLDPEVAAAYIAKNKQVAGQRVIYYGGSSRALDYFDAILAQRGLGGAAARTMRAIPLDPFGRAETSFFTAGEVVRNEFWRVLSPKAIEQGQGYELARILDRITGLSDSAALGVPTTVRQMEQSFVWFAPNYTRACMTVMADVFRGGYTGNQARRALGGLAAAGAVYFAGTQYSIAKLQGKSDEEAWRLVLEGFNVYQDPITGDWDWRPSATFMTLKVGNYSMSVGGFWYGMYRLMGNIAETDNIVNLANILDGRNNPFIYWWYSRSSPFVGTGFELYSGKDFLGYPIETPTEYARYLATRFEPIWMEQGINWMIPGFARDTEIPQDTATAVVTAAGEFIGLREFPESAWVRFYNQAEEVIKSIPEDVLREYFTEEEMPKILEAQENGTLQWQHLPDRLQEDLLMGNEGLLETRQKAENDSFIRGTEEWKAWTERTDAEKQIYYDTGSRLVGLVQNGKLNTQDMRDQWSDAGMIYGNALEVIARDPAHAEIYAYFEERASEEPKYGWQDDIALKEYQTVLFTDYSDENGDYDWDARDAAIADFIDRWGEEKYNMIRSHYLDEKLVEGMSPVLVQLARDRDALGKAYWDLPYTEFINMTEDDVVQGNIPSQYIGLWRQYQALKSDKAREAFLEAHPEMTKDWRAEYRKAHPEEDAMLALWGYSGKLQTYEAYNKVVEMGQNLGIPIEMMGLGLPPDNLVDDYFAYWDLPAGGARKDYRFKHPEWDAWLVESMGYTPVSGSAEETLPPPHPVGMHNLSTEEIINILTGEPARSWWEGVMWMFGGGEMSEEDARRIMAQYGATEDEINELIALIGTAYEGRTIENLDQLIALFEELRRKEWYASDILMLLKGELGTAEAPEGAQYYRPTTPTPTLTGAGARYMEKTGEYPPR